MADPADDGRSRDAARRNAGREAGRDGGRETTRAPAPSSAARRASAPYAEKTRGYYRTLSATSVGLEMAISVVVPLFFGLWLDRKAGTTPWLMLLCLCFGFAAGVRAVWRYVAAADREAAESERERGAPPPTGPAGGQADDDARGRP
ncbi:MAG TPA: AtpZ/AtpI family protein [Kofleriaceae bacterium]|nr:AtpZ/AtpI family protein [Kofleriaceae bacterium]